ncbi:MAG: AtpZ/AtpI family protein [bacterium]|nr:AtpZ/AtpI family protein [bacterium]
MPSATTQHSHNQAAQNQQSYRAGDALSAAFELVATPALFGFFGWLIDRALGTKPLFALLLGIMTAIYAGWKAFHTYSERMARYDQALPSYRYEASYQEVGQRDVSQTEADHLGRTRALGHGEAEPEKEPAAMRGCG